MLTRVLFVPDSHFPNVDPKSWQTLLNFTKDFRPNEVVILGDFQDCYAVSDFHKDPQKTERYLSKELEPGIEALAELESISKTKKFIYLEGNHEARIRRYFTTYAAILSDQRSTREILKLPKYYLYLPYGQSGHYHIGNWVATHGSIFNVNVAASMVQKYGCNVIFGHVHRFQTFSQKKFNGEVLTAITPGWLGSDKQAAEYVKDTPNSQHGFAYGYFRQSGKGSVTPVLIDQGKAIVNGKCYG